MGCLGRERGPSRPGGSGVGWGGRDGEEGGVGCRRRGLVAAPGGAGGPPPSRAGSVGVSVPRGVGRGRDRRRGGVACGLVSPSCLACPPPPVQVPSASRRGGLKTLWGSPVRLGSGRSGPWGGGFPSPPDSAAHPTPPGPGLLRHATASARPSGGGYPGGPVGPCVCVCPVSLGVCGGAGGNPLGACGVVRASPLAWGAVAGCPVVQPFRPSRSLVSLVSDWPAGGTPSGEMCCARGGRPSGGWPP